MLESMKDLVYRHTGLFPPKLPQVRTLEEPDAEMLQTIEDLQTVCLFLGPNRNLTHSPHQFWPYTHHARCSAMPANAYCRLRN